MARAVNRLSAKKVQALAEPGRHADGGGLYLYIDSAGSKRWVLLYRIGGRRREMGLGPVGSVSLSRARELAADARALVASGTDPIDAKRASETQTQVAPPMTFGAVASAYMEAQKAVWRSPVHRHQWRQTLEIQAASLWTMPVAMIDTEAVLRVLRPIWNEKPETAKRIRGRIERILNAARAAGHRTGENPALWRGHLDFLLPRPPKLTRGHHPAMPYRDVPAFVQAIQQRPGLSARALEVLILTAARSGEIRGMVWGELDLEAALWVVPAERMKAKREHRVPLQARVVEILNGVRPNDPLPGALVFPSSVSRKLSDMVFEALLRRAKANAYTAHGFRSSFRDWAGDETTFPRDVVEVALAHTVGDATELAYRRGDALEKRRHLMEAWAAFIAEPVKGKPVR
jgi:integrase